MDSSHSKITSEALAQQALTPQAHAADTAAEPAGPSAADSYGERHNAWNHPTVSSESDAQRQPGRSGQLGQTGQPMTLAESILLSTQDQSQSGKKIVLRIRNAQPSDPKDDTP